MEEGINLSVVLSGATLVGIIGIFVRVWISGKAHQIEPTLCERQIKSNSADHENIFARLGASEQRISTLEAHNEHTSRTLTRMEHKLDKLIEQETKQ